ISPVRTAAAVRAAVSPPVVRGQREPTATDDRQPVGPRPAQRLGNHLDPGQGHCARLRGRLLSRENAHPRRRQPAGRAALGLRRLAGRGGAAAGAGDGGEPVHRYRRPRTAGIGCEGGDHRRRHPERRPQPAGGDGGDAPDRRLGLVCSRGAAGPSDRAGAHLAPGVEGVAVALAGLLQSLWEAVTQACMTVLSMAAIVIPLMVVVEYLREWRLFDRLSEWLAPGAGRLGLSGNAAFPLAAGAVLGLSYGSGLIIESAREGRLTRQEAYVLTALLAPCH